MNKFKAGQEVVIVSGIMYGVTATIIEVLPRGLLNWYNLKIEGKFDSISYLECELRSLN